MKKIILIAILALVCIQFHAQEKLKWYTLQEAIELNKKQPKKFLIDMYTNWCGWCKKMDAETFNHPAIAAFIKDNFYPVKFNAETHDTIEFKGKKYYNRGLFSRSPHELAVMLMNNKMSYPTIVYLDEELNTISAVPGYMSPADIEPVLIFFARNLYKIYPFEEFKKDFYKTFKDTVPFVDKIKWLSFNQALKKQTKKLIFFTHDACIDCKIMHRTSFQEKQNADYLNEHYACVYFNVLTTDTIEFLGNKFINEQKEHPFHQLAVYLSNGHINLPQIIFMDEKNNLLSSVPGFFPQNMFEILIHFFEEEAYKKTSWDEYVKNYNATKK